jgi:hypothetical protein
MRLHLLLTSPETFICLSGLRRPLQAEILPHASFSPVFRRNPMRKNKAQIQNENEQDNRTDG